MASGKIVRTVSTKVDADGAAKSTVFTVDFAGCSDDVLKAMAYNYLTVKRQGSWRRKGIPVREEIVAANFAPGSRSAEPVTLESTMARAGSLTAEEKKALAALLLAEFADVDGVEGAEADIEAGEETETE